MCRSVFVCWLSALSNGLREGDIGKIMQPTGSSDPLYPILVVYQVPAGSYDQKVT